MLYWFLKSVVLGPVLKLLFRPWVEGGENIPEEGAAIFASNHLQVKEWKTVVNYDPRTLKLTTALPSDHSLVRATLTLP